MMRVYLFIVSSSLLCNLEVGNGAKAVPKTYHKSPPSAAAPPDAEVPHKETIILEGQMPPMETIVPVPGKTNTTKEVVKKGSKTVARKGVIDKSVEKTDTSNNKTAAVPLEMVNKHKNIPLSSVIKTASASVTKLSTSTEKWHVAPVSEVIPKEVQPGVKKTGRKPKPETTVSDGKEPDGPIASPTKTSSLSMPSKIDYIVPAAITLTVLPLLGAAFLVLYRRGRDYWDKRHYRRMDFLIDGMYNE